MKKRIIYFFSIICLLVLNCWAEKKKPTYADVRYSEEYDRSKLDIWLAESDTPTPLVINFHGGGFRHGDKGSFQRFIGIPSGRPRYFYRTFTVRMLICWSRLRFLGMPWHTRSAAGSPFKPRAGRVFSPLFSSCLARGSCHRRVSDLSRFWTSIFNHVSASPLEQCFHRMCNNDSQTTLGKASRICY